MQFSIVIIPQKSGNVKKKNAHAAIQSLNKCKKALHYSARCDILMSRKQGIAEEYLTASDLRSIAGF